MKYVSIRSVISKSAITPFLSGWMTRISGGVRPIIALASLPTARTEWSSSWIDTIEGSLRTMPSPRTNTSVFDVPRAIATALQNLCNNIRPLSAIVAGTQRIPFNRVEGGHRQPEEISAASRSIYSRADGVEELGAGEGLVEEGGAGDAKGLVRFFADGAGGDEGEPVADRGAAGGDLTEQLPPVDPLQGEVSDDQCRP